MNSKTKKGVQPAARPASFHKRKSFKGPPDIPEDIPQNDDEAEREHSKRASGKFGQLAKQRLSLGGITELSTSELVAQYTNCMRLSAENKINHKNAFSLPLIDCMKLLLKKKDEQMDNFQVVGCTLDASARIYASRVDRVHMDGMSFAKGLGSRARELPVPRNNGSDEDEPGEENAGNIKKKKYKKNHKLVSKNTTKINITLDAAEPDETYLILSKQFSNCQPSFVCFIPQLDVVGDSCKMLLDMKRPFLSMEEEIQHDMQTNVEFECEADGNLEIIGPPFREILARDSGDIDYDSLINASTLEDTLLEEDNNVDDPFSHSHNENGNATVIRESYSEVGRNNCAWNGFSNLESEATRAGNVAKNGPRERVVDLKEAILKQVKAGSNSDYMYMNLDRILFAGPSHWGRLPISREKEKKLALEGGKKRERKVNNLDFEQLKEVNILISRSCTFTSAYTETNWLSDKVTNPVVLHLDPKILLRYFNREKAGVNINYRKNQDILPQEDDDGDVNDYDYDNLNDSQQFCPAPILETEGDDVVVNSLHDGPEGEEPAADVHSSEKPDSSDGWSMVDPPNKVARIAVPYAQHAKKVDMKVLKTAIWSVLCGEKQNEVNGTNLTPKGKKRINNNNHIVKNKKSCQADFMVGQMEFSEMERKVMKIVPKEMAEELSMPLIFTALLHLANERILFLDGLEDHSDIIISQDSNAESFIRRLEQRQFV